MEVLTEHQPPQVGVVRFCKGCGRNDRTTSLKDVHFAGSKLCTGEIATLEYVLVDLERSRLEKAVIEAAKKWVGFYNGSSEFFSDTKLADEINALIEFESNQQQVKK